MRKGQRRRVRAFGAGCLIKVCVVSEVYACGGNGAALVHLNGGYRRRQGQTLHLHLCGANRVKPLLQKYAVCLMF